MVEIMMDTDIKGATRLVFQEPLALRLQAVARDIRRIADNQIDGTGQVEVPKLFEQVAHYRGHPILRAQSFGIDTA